MYSQETLPNILQRGYISQWLLCGPFPSDLGKGIKEALRNKEAPLGTRDFFANNGGINQLLPKAGETIQVDGISYPWTPFTVKSPTIDLSTLQPPDEGIYFFSAYVQVPEDQIIYVNLQTPLGARFWISKTKIKDIQSLPIEHLGIDRALVRLRKGLNLFVLQIPFLSVQSISEITKIPVEHIPSKLWSNKEPNIGKTGYEFSLHIQPIQPAGLIYYVPLLEPSQKFTGSPIDSRQVFYLTLYNPTQKQVFPVNVNAWFMPQSSALPNQQLSLQPQEEVHVPLEIPNKGRQQDEKASVRILITAPDNAGKQTTSEFTTQITFISPETPAKTYLITGVWGKPAKDAEVFQQIQQEIDWCKYQTWNAYENSNYGINIGTSNIWLSMLEQNPDLILQLRDVIFRGNSTSQNIFAPLDERLVSIETLIMNYLMGTKLKESIMKDFFKSFIAWDYPYLSPQSSQIINQCNINGVVTNLSFNSLPPLLFWNAPFDNSVMMRVLQTPPSFRNFQEIKKWAHLAHEGLSSLIPEMDVLVIENTASYPNLKILPNLKNEIPPFNIQGNGVADFFENVKNFINEQGTNNIPSIFQPLYSNENLSELFSNTLLRTCLYLLEEKLIQSQIMSTVAGTLGMTYPGEVIARLWSLLLQAANHKVINATLTEQENMTILSQLCMGISDTDKIIQRTTKYCADNVNTLTHLTNNLPHSYAIVVFNPNSSTKTLPAVTDIPTPTTPFSLLSHDGKPVPYILHSIKGETSSITSYKVEFVAENIPSYGVKTFYLIPDKKTYNEISTNDNFIENEFLLVRVDTNTGDLISIIDKTTGKDILPTNTAADTLGFLNTETGNFISFAGTVNQFTTSKSELLQRIEIQYQTKEGKLNKEYRLYKSINQIYCFHQFTPTAETPDKCLASKFIAPDSGKIPIYGSQSFAFTKPLFLMSDNPKFFFGHRLFALGSGDRIKKEDDSYIPMGDTTIIDTGEKETASLQNEIMKTLWNRGIPSNKISLQEMEQLKSKNASLYLWLGTLKSYDNLKTLFSDSGFEVQNEIFKRTSIGTPFLIEVNQNNTSYKILGFVADTSEKLNPMINNFLNMLNQRGEFLIPSAVCNVDGIKSTENGIAILFPGTKPILEQSSNIFYLCHGKVNFKESSIDSLPIQYRILPFSSHWLQSEILQQSTEKTSVSVVTDFHGGPWTDNTSFLSLDNPELVISSIKPIGTGIPLIQSEPQNPTDMFTVRINSLTSKRQETSLNSSFTINNIQTLTPLEATDPSSINLNNQSITFKPWEIKTFAVSLKKVTSPNRVPFDLSNIYLSSGLTTSFPLYNEFQSILLRIKPVSTSNTTNIQLTICNLNANESAKGIVNIESPSDYTIAPTQLPYELPPLSMSQQLIQIELPDSENTYPLINAWTEVNGKTIRAFLSKEEFPAKIRYEKNINQIKIIVENTQPLPLYGNITWTAFNYSLLTHTIQPTQDIKPEQTDIYLTPYESKEFMFIFDNMSLSESNKPVAHIQLNDKVQFLAIK